MMYSRRTILWLIGLGLMVPGQVLGQSAPGAGLSEAVVEAKLTALAEGQLRLIAREPLIYGAVVDQNRRHNGFSHATISRLDGDWRREVYTQTNRKLIPEVMGNPASRYLETVVALSGGLYTEFMLIDALGLNVALAGLTPDYWQGDEDKFLKTFPVGLRAIHIGPPERNTSTNVWQRQVSITVTDPASLLPIGALCAGVDLDLL